MCWGVCLFVLKGIMVLIFLYKSVSGRNELFFFFVVLVPKQNPTRCPQSVI